MGVKTSRLAGLVVGTVLLSGCETLGDLFGSPPEEILPGERISILTIDRGLSPDASVAEVPVLLSEPYVNERWTQYGGSPTHATYHLALAQEPRRAWSSDLGTGAASDRRILAQPLVVDGTIYGMDALSTVTAFDAERGRTLWRQELEPEFEERGYFGGGLAFENGRLFVSTGFAEVMALNAADGQVIWRRRVPGPMRAAPTAAGGRVFVVTTANQTIAMSADDGRQLWTHSGIEEATGLLGAASPAVSGSMVVAPYSSGEIFGLLAENGRPLWSESLAAISRTDPLADIAQIRGAPVIDRDMVFAVSHSGRMIAIDLRRGLRVWERKIGGVEMPWVGGDFIFVLSNDAQLVSLTRRDGRIRWVRPLDRFEDPEDQEDPVQWAGPVLAGDRLIIAGSHGKALSVSPYTGEIIGAIDLPGAVSIAPVVAANALYIVTDSGSLVAMR